MLIKRLSKVGFTLLMAVSFSMSAYADVFDQYNPFDGGNYYSTTFAADPDQGEANVIGHAYPGQSSENLGNNTFYGENIIENEIDVRSTSNIYDGNTYIGVGVYDDGVLTSNDDLFTNSVLDSGDLDIVVSDIYTPSGTSNITNADVNQIATLTASSQTGAGSTLNVNTSSFTGATTLSADTINLQNSTITQQVGSTADTQQIIANTAQSNIFLSDIACYIKALVSFLTNSYYSSNSNSRTYNVTYGSSTYTVNMPGFTRNVYTIQDQHINKTSSTAYGTLPTILDYKMQDMQNLFYAYAELFNNWYYPLRVTTPLYWHTYNLDTDQEEVVNLARVFYDISWYTAHTYDSIETLIDDFDTYATAFGNYVNQFASYALNFNNYKTAFENYVGQWNFLASKLLVLVDNVCVWRRTDDTNNRTVSLGNHFGINVQYTLQPYNVTTVSYSNNIPTYTTTTYYGNYNSTFWNAINEHTNLFQYGFREYLTEWQDLARNMLCVYDSLVNYRIYNEPHTIDLGYHFGANTSYPAGAFIITTTDFDENGRLTNTNTRYYGTFRTSLQYRIQSIVDILVDWFTYTVNNNLASNISNSVSTLNSNLNTYTQAEQTLQNRVTSSLQSFIPDLTLLSGFVAISWVSNYLQQVYVSLGAYGTVIMIGLLLGVCMQFIGYFRYKY